MRATRAATACGYVLGAELRACGVDLSFHAGARSGSRPQWRHRRPGVCARCPRVVSLLAKSLMHGLLQSGMANCGKHFPGHGFTVAADSHTDLPVDKRSLKAILAQDAAPYGWLGTALASVMPAHVCLSAVDSRPAGFSTRWLQDILRGRLGFAGAVFSDDLSMAGARQIDGKASVTYGQAAVAALGAGCDLVLLCNQCLEGNTAIDAWIADMAQAQAVGLWQPRAASEQRRLALLPRTPAMDWDDLMVHPHYMQSLDLIA
jgi:beta-N-acetylhexosaminidase